VRTNRFNMAKKDRELALVRRELAEVRLELNRIEAFASPPSPSTTLH
jgi:hypothetical protein